ncbi:MAG: NUDIX domain-containing protein [Treponema sp.]|nr:NUDIX domain-containing protein [Treponema sp.]
MKNNFNMCPICGSKAIQNKNGRKWLCPECGFDLYNNVAAAVGVIISDKEHNVLLEVRAKEPRKGFLAFPGGFVDADESAEEAVVRECREEIGAEVTNIKYLCTFPNTYEYKNIEYKTCDMFFTAELAGKFNNMDELIQSLHGQESEVQGFVSQKVDSIEAVDKIPLAFISANKTLKKWVEKNADN